MNELIRIFEEVLYLGAIASIPVLLILVIKKLFRKVVSPKWHYYIWVLLIIRLLLPYIPESSFSILNLVYAVTEQSNLLENQIEETILYGPNAVRDIAENINEANSSTITDEKEEAQQAEAPRLQPHKAESKLTFRGILALFWLSGVIILSAYTISANIIFAVRLRRYYEKITDSRIEAIFDDCKRILKVKGRISLYTSPIARTPSLYTALHTRILMSEEYMKKLSDQEIRYIFLHELTHYKRKDIVVNWMLMLLQIIYFFQPLLWYAFFKIHEDCEISCDAEVLKYFSEDHHLEYGSTILKLLKLHADSRFIPVTAGIGKHKSSYRRRIIMIRQFKKYRWTNTLITLVLIMAVGLVALTGCSPSAGNANPNNNDTTTPLVTSTPNTTPTTAVTPTPIITETPEQDTQANEDTTDESNSIQEDAEDNALEEQISFYGDWTISRVLAFGQSGTFSKEEAEGLVGRSMSFSSDSATCFGDQASYIDTTAKEPSYMATVYTSNDFMSYYRMTFELLGLVGDEVTEIVAKDSEGNGCTFLIKDENTLIVVGGGTYFVLVRN